MERTLTNRNGTIITFKWVEKWREHLMRSEHKDGGMHLMFIRDIEKEIEMLKGEGYVNVAG